MKYVITEPEFGIYVGSAIGLGFWSKLDSVGQDSVPVFDTEEQAQEHIASWEPDEDDERVYSFVEVDVPHDAEFATVYDLVDAGLEDMLGDMAENLPTVGNA